MLEIYDVLVDYSGELIKSFETKAEANKWLIENYTEYSGKHKDNPKCTLPYVVRIERRKTYLITLYDRFGIMRKQGDERRIANFLDVDPVDITYLLMRKYIDLPRFESWFLEIEFY